MTLRHGKVSFEIVKQFLVSNFVLDINNGFCSNLFNKFCCLEKCSDDKDFYVFFSGFCMLYGNALRVMRDREFMESKTLTASDVDYLTSKILVPIGFTMTISPHKFAPALRKGVVKLCRLLYDRNIRTNFVKDDNIWVRRTDTQKLLRAQYPTLGTI